MIPIGMSISNSTISAGIAITVCRGVAEGGERAERRQAHAVPWCSGYHICLTRRRSPVRNRAEPSEACEAPTPFHFSLLTVHRSTRPRTTFGRAHMLPTHGPQGPQSETSLWASPPKPCHWRREGGRATTLRWLGSLRAISKSPAPRPGLEPGSST